MRIRTAIFGVYVAASALGFAVLMGFVLRDVRLRYLESMRRTLGDTAAFLAASITPAAATSDRWAGQLTALASDAGLLRVFACDAAGRVTFDSAHGADVGRLYEWPMRGGGRAASENYSVSNVAEVGGELRVAAPVRRGGAIVGWVGVGRPVATVAEGVSHARGQLALVAVLVGAVMTAAGWWIAARLTHSLERLAVYAEDVRAGRPAAPPASRATEIAALGRAFEEMRLTLEGKAYVEHYAQALAHEFKAPLSAIRGAAELLAENPPPTDRARFVANLRAETDRLQLIVERLLELAALESRRAGDGFATIDLVPLLAEAHAAALARAEARGISVGLDLPSALPARGDRFLLAQAVLNLVQNAIEFTPAGGTVTLAARAGGGRVTIGIDDTGVGVPDYARERIFERFYSLPRPDTGRKSSGLGLSIVREIARLHGGEVTLANRPGGGARALLALPAD